MMLPSPDKQFSLQPDGRIFFQPDISNPTPGIAIGQIEKGSSVLKPHATLADSEIFEGQDKVLIAGKLQDWLNISIHLALEPLFRLVAGDDHTEASRSIAESLFEALGIVQRDTIQNEIAKLDEEGRKALRNRKVRMGPIIVYMPELNKPAGIKLRALLLTLWQGGALPAQTPTDGMVSLSIVDKQIDADFYRKIGYPVYGPRAIRVDMLDRVICAIYDAADKGVFKANHKMAEWLGSNITDLYAVLEAMGHVKISDPTDEKLKIEAAPIGESVPIAQELPESVMSADMLPVSEEPPTADTPSEESAEKKPVSQPELATFRLKRNNKPEYKDRPKKDFRKDENKVDNKDKPKFEKKKFKDKPRDKDRAPRDDRDKVYTANAAIQDNPFSILQQLKTNHEK